MFFSAPQFKASPQVIHALGERSYVSVFLSDATVAAVAKTAEQGSGFCSVSYTHLTLPTIYSV